MDPYVEFDHTLISIDLFLNKIKAFRHVLFNYEYREQGGEETHKRREVDNINKNSNEGADTDNNTNNSNNNGNANVQNNNKTNKNKTQLLLQMGRLALFVYVCDVGFRLYPLWLELNTQNTKPAEWNSLFNLSTIFGIMLQSLFCKLFTLLSGSYYAHFTY